MGESVPAVPPVNGGSVFGNGVMAASADGKYLFLATPSGVRQYTLPGTAAVPAAPTGLTATAISSSQINLAWNAVSGATSYNLYRSSNSGAEGSTPYRTGLTANSFTDTGLSNGTTYYYQVTAVSSGGESARSAEVSATPQAAGSPVLALDAGGAAAGSFAADADFSGGQVYSTSAPVATAAASPARRRRRSTTRSATATSPTPCRA